MQYLCNRYLYHTDLTIIMVCKKVHTLYYKIQSLLDLVNLSPSTVSSSLTAVDGSETFIVDIPNFLADFRFTPRSSKNTTYVRTKQQDAHYINIRIAGKFGECLIIILDGDRRRQMHAFI